MKENWRKKALVIAGLIIAGSGLIVIISLRLKSSEPIDTQEAIVQEAEAELVVSPERSEMITEQTEPEAETTDFPDIPETTSNTTATQYIQEEPVKTENEKPSEPAEEVVETEETKKEKPDKQKKSENTKPAEKKVPAKTDSTKSSSSTSKSPKTGDKKDGKIYIEGFGWVDDEGGGTEVIEADDMYENGNTIATMD